MSIPTREEHKKKVRRIWIICTLAALFVVGSMAGLVTIMVVKNVEIQRTVGASTICFQMVVAGAFLGFTMPLFLEQRENLTLSLEMGRRGLEVSEQMTEYLQKLQSDLVEVIGDLRKAISETKGAHLEKAASAIEALPGKLDSLIAKIEKRGVDDVIENL